ncbi:MAG: hypothetical protein KTR25_15780 [Myxococcales bacterium]|nr:hypothetical protein [Myxococcales bacterium]
MGINADQTPPACDPEDNTADCSEDPSSEDPDDLAFSFAFEDGALPDALSQNGGVELSQERAFDGESSVKITSDGGGYNRNFISLSLSDSELQEQLYGRMMVWLDEPTTGNGGDFTFVQADGPPQAQWIEAGAPENTNVMYRARVDGGQRNGTLMSNYDTYTDNDGDGATDWLTDCYDHSTTQLPREEWACVEWMFDKANNELKYWLNGEEVTEINVVEKGEGCLGDTQDGEWTAPESFEVIHFGIEQYSPEVPPRTMFIDDIALGESYIGCPN